VTYDPYEHANAKRWWTPIAEALQHAHEEVHTHGFKVQYLVRVVPDESVKELPVADNGEISDGPLCPRCGTIMNALSGCHKVCPGCKYDDQECGA
jgi:hypothetical protein